MVLREPKGEVPLGYLTGEGWLETSPYPVRLLFIFKFQKPFTAPNSNNMN